MNVLHAISPVAHPLAHASDCVLDLTPPIRSHSFYDRITSNIEMLAIGTAVVLAIVGIASSIFAGSLLFFTNSVLLGVCALYIRHVVSEYRTFERSIDALDISRQTFEEQAFRLRDIRNDLEKLIDEQRSIAANLQGNVDRLEGHIETFGLNEALHRELLRRQEEAQRELERLAQQDRVLNEQLQATTTRLHDTTNALVIIERRLDEQIGRFRTENDRLNELTARIATLVGS